MNIIEIDEAQKCFRIAAQLRERARNIEIDARAEADALRRRAEEYALKGHALRGDNATTAKGA